MVKWWVEAYFYFNPDTKRHIGFKISLGKGSVYSTSEIQMPNKIIYTEYELAVVDNVML